MSVLGTHLYQCTSWHCCDRRHLASWICLKTLSMHLPISQWVIYGWTCHTALRVHQFLMKNGMTTMPHPYYSPDLKLNEFFWFLRLKQIIISPQRKMFTWCGRGETNNPPQKKHSRSTKKHQNQWIQKLFWAVEKTSHCVSSNGEYFEFGGSLNM